MIKKRYYFPVFAWTTLSLLILLIPAFLGAFAVDEGTAGGNPFVYIGLGIFYVEQFPLLYLCRMFDIKIEYFGFFMALALDSIFWGLLAERIFYF
jgi:hypothetical protein